ncbi:MAG: hypothetical protein WCJ93_01675 [Methanomicrobiales archaeon]
MIIPVDFKDYYYPILLLAGILLFLCIFRIRHMLLDIHRGRRGLQQFLTCHGKERWGPPVRVKEWRRNAIRHLIAQRETLDNDIWQIKNRRNNLAEMEREERRKLSELNRARKNAKMAGNTDQSLFIGFEISRNNAKTEDLNKRILDKEVTIHSMEQALKHADGCLTSYMKEENPRLPVMRYIRGLFFDLR